eukprot:TRINITY_DN4614_c0_g1_i2.p1 TRINITY_DN4614_c0_g1~~TRINITY_DN4614_c0_g1_i2.p1  ORF type:complete len:359 (+),score=90.96 TRINITY_DN4614_c0_g1_i2:49-1125(+)
MHRLGASERSLRRDSLNSPNRTAVREAADAAIAELDASADDSAPLEVALHDGGAVAPASSSTAVPSSTSPRQGEAVRGSVLGTLRGPTLRSSRSPLRVARLSHTHMVQSFTEEGKQVLALVADEHGIQEGAACASKEEPAAAVAFLGPTHAGKSTLVKALMGLDVLNSSDGPSTPALDEESFEPTSADVHVLFAGHNTFLLDCEGGDSGEALPHCLDDAPNFSEEEMQAYFKARRRAVEEHFPRLAYVVSNVIVHVMTESFAKHSWKRVVEEVALSAAVEGVVNAEAPSLVLVWNQANKKQAKKSIDQLTESFFNAHDKQKRLLDLYANVQCVAVPEYDDEDEDSIEFFQQCIGKLDV